jgi:hypothetical protein
MIKLSRPKAAAVAVTAVGLCLGVAAPALADIQPASNDVVGAGSDTLQYAANFLFDGDTSGDPGYNTGVTNRVFSFDAVGDASGRTSYANNDAASAQFAATSVLRQGTAPVTRPNGSGAGVAALYTAPYTGLGSAPGYVGVQFARMSRLPKCSENSSASAFGGLHVYQMGTEQLAMARKVTGSNVKAGLTLQQILFIYTTQNAKWSDVPGLGSADTAVIDPLIPQSGSGTRGVFDSALASVNGGVIPTYAGYVESVQENDFNAFTIARDPANALAPFSGARITLNNSGYFGASAQNQVALITSGTSWVTTRPLYFVVRQNDVTSSKKFQPGGTQNYVQALFGAAGILADPIYASNIQAAGFTPNYSDLGAPGQQGVSCT